MHKRRLPNHKRWERNLPHAQRNLSLSGKLRRRSLHPVALSQGSAEQARPAPLCLPAAPGKRSQTQTLARCVRFPRACGTSLLPSHCVPLCRHTTSIARPMRPAGPCPRKAQAAENGRDLALGTTTAGGVQRALLWGEAGAGAAEKRAHAQRLLLVRCLCSSAERRCDERFCMWLTVLGRPCRPLMQHTFTPRPWGDGETREDSARLQHSRAAVSCWHLMSALPLSIQQSSKWPFRDVIETGSARLTFELRIQRAAFFHTYCVLLNA